mmetsp:Transcript_25939/g.58557  ORF Transcript_25939/g.58557 Transcript_25939/m.58557 type:complete len:431 (+) Transcript_25939:1038-2330(+)
MVFVLLPHKLLVRCFCVRQLLLEPVVRILLLLGLALVLGLELHDHRVVLALGDLQLLLVRTLHVLLLVQQRPVPLPLHRQLLLVERLELLRRLHVRPLHVLYRLHRLQLLLLLAPAQGLKASLRCSSRRLHLFLHLLGLVVPVLLLQMELVLRLDLNLSDLVLEVRHGRVLLLHIASRDQHNVEEGGGVQRLLGNHLSLLHEMYVELEHSPVLRRHEQDTVVRRCRHPCHVSSRHHIVRPLRDQPLHPPDVRQNQPLRRPREQNLVVVGQQQLLHAHPRRPHLPRRRALDKLRDLPIISTSDHRVGTLVVHNTRVVHVPRHVLFHSRVALKRPLVDGTVDTSRDKTKIVRREADGLDHGRVRDEYAELLEGVGGEDDDVGDVDSSKFVSTVAEAHLFTSFDRKLLKLTEIVHQDVEEAKLVRKPDQDMEA